jgi:endonuclease YncB( thermonuclease family)
MSCRVALLVAILATLLATERATFPSQAADQRLSIIDGDTLQVDGETIQLYGIDAPELGQLCQSEGRATHCGVNAGLALGKLVSLNASSLHCSPWSDGRSAPPPPPAPTAKVCEVGDQDLAILMLRSGNSLAVPGAFPDYLEAERQARAARLGIWHSDFVTPWDWRAGAHAPSPSSDSARDCNVKGVFGADGRRLYYVPTDPRYRAITLDHKRGETMFCSDEEAREGGWRRIGESASADE